MVRASLGDESAGVQKWSYDVIQDTGPGQLGLGRSVYRLTGTARGRGGLVEWSLILKIQSDDIQRERMTFESGLLDELPDDLVAPRCFGLVEKPDGDYWIWLEDVSGLYGESWPWERLVVASRQLGQFNGSFAARRDVLEQPWLLCWPFGNWDGVGDIISQLRGAQDYPLIKRAFPPEVADGVHKMWVHRRQFLGALEALPRGLGHGDVQRRNLFSRSRDGRDETVLIDWGSTATSPLGVEIHKITSTVRYLRDYSMAQIRELRQSAYSEYIAGLRDAGWRGDERQVRLGYAIAVSLCNALSELPSIYRVGTEESAQDRARVTIGDRPIEENMDRRRELLRMFLDLAEEAYELLDRGVTPSAKV